MVRMVSTVCDSHKESKQTLKKRFEQETVPELQKQIDALIEKIGCVNLIALLDAINSMAVTDISPYSHKDYRDNWFILKGKNGECASSIEVLVDNKLEWRERWVDVYGELIFGSK